MWTNIERDTAGVGTTRNSRPTTITTPATPDHVNCRVPVEVGGGEGLYLASRAYATGGPPPSQTAVSRYLMKFCDTTVTQPVAWHRPAVRRLYSTTGNQGVAYTWIQLTNSTAQKLFVGCNLGVQLGCNAAVCGQLR